MYLSHDDPSDIVLESHGQGDMQILTKMAHWLRSFLTHAHPDLGRKGAVCPFMEQSLKLGRTALSSVDISGPRGTGRLANTARLPPSRGSGTAARPTACTTPSSWPGGGVRRGAP